MILADENIDFNIITHLRSKGIEVYSIKENHPGISDKQVITLSKNEPRIILTEDKDFGEWVYAHDEKGISVILLRYQFGDTDLILSILVELIESRKDDLFGKFVTISPQKISIRSLK
ncbi:DUF5615 family PIN-like protein [Fulvivirgaceae bacterium BMA12]|uniref:DUF5615 family PIN-like protein n=1 Tax=Agaribacillus aureus TaxID=3051825 RepID=A0ABT8L5W8_9BACT|nr:DUF5615 family PIN-like protein [Fulvivirgaceae bacterium BMA12]